MSSVQPSTPLPVQKPKGSLKGSLVPSISFPLFKEEEIEGDVLPQAELYLAKQKKIVRLIQLQSYVISFLLILIIVLAPVLRPIYQYMAMNPQGQKVALASMTVPNLTDMAIMSWSATVITDILTFGFGDLDQRIISQQSKFTKDGWYSFIKGFIEKKVRDVFRGSQLVLTTAPSDMPVIVNKGEDIDGIYKWVVEMPVIMNYATNNMVSRRSQAVIRLILVRVPTSQNEAGIGIDSWIVQ